MGVHLDCLWSPCVALISVVVADCCPLTAGPNAGGPQRAGYMASPPEGRAAGVGLGKRLVTVVVAATAGEPQSMTGGGPDEGRRYPKSSPTNGGYTGVFASSELSRFADGGLRRRRPSLTSLFASTEEFLVFRALIARAMAIKVLFSYPCQALASLHKDCAC